MRLCGLHFCGDSVFYDARWKQRENYDSVSITSLARTVDWCQKKVANTENGQLLARVRLEPSNFLFPFFRFKGGIVIYTPPNSVILFEVLKAVLQFGASFLITKVQGRITGA